MKIQLFGLLLVAILLVGCQATGNVIKETDNAADVTLKSLHVLTSSTEDVDVPSEDEVSVFITNGGFSPSVIEARVGQTITVTSYVGEASAMDKEKIHFSIPELGVEESLREADVFEFVAKEAGEFTFICMDCSPMLKGTLLVE
jgi:plastocyanin domain-containing protein